MFCSPSYIISKFRIFYRANVNKLLIVDVILSLDIMYMIILIKMMHFTFINILTAQFFWTQFAQK